MALLLKPAPARPLREVRAGLLSAARRGFTATDSCCSLSRLRSPAKPGRSVTRGGASDAPWRSA